MSVCVRHHVKKRTHWLNFFTYGNYIRIYAPSGFHIVHLFKVASSIAPSLHISLNGHFFFIHYYKESSTSDWQSYEFTRKFIKFSIRS